MSHNDVTEARYQKYQPFMHRKQLRKLLFATLLRWLFTAAIVGSIYGVLISYSDREAMRHKKKSQFNTIMLALSILLSMNLVSSLKAMAGDLRWWALSLRDWPVGEADLVLGGDQLTHLAKLAFMTRLWSVRAAVLCWVFINMAAQAGVATLGVTYSVDVADVVTVTKPGIVSIPDMSQIETNKVLASNKTSHATAALRYTANSYGLVALAFGSSGFDDIPKPGTLLNPDDSIIFCEGDSCSFTFYEATTDESHYMAVATNRSVTASAECEGWRVLDGGSGNKTTITIDDGNKTEISLPATNGDSQTTFILDLDDAAGDDWSVVTAFEASSQDPWYYICLVRIGAVKNAVIPEQELGVGVTSLAVSAIALQGFGGSSQETSKDTTRQFQSYPAESNYGEPQGGNVTGMASLMAAFTTGVVAVTASANSNIQARGLVPLRGVHLKISHWEYVHLILCLILGVQLLLGLISVLLANTVAVRSHSQLELTELLRPVSQKLGYHRSFALHEKAGTPREPTMRYRRARLGDYYFETNFASVDSS